ncbi:MAG: D-alanyl-D-alanine carboxypeptidase [Pseudomonadota bacterium]
MSGNYTCLSEVHMRHHFLYLILILGYSSSIFAENPLATLDSLPQSSLLVINAQEIVEYSKNSDQLFIPASTVKIMTALTSVNHWDSDHHFQTEFYLDEQTNMLWVRGLGDPFLVSEELDLIVQQLKEIGLTEAVGIGLDETYFEPDIYFHGRGKSNNPYDAPANALAVNFNTIQVNINNGVISSGEPQTPITPMAKKLAKGLPDGKHRINLLDAIRSAEYFAQVFAAKLSEQGIRVGDVRDNALVPKTADLILSYQNSKNVSEVLSAMLLYSNNFIANQLYLMLGAEKFAAPATLLKAQMVVDEYINEHFAWTNYLLIDGSGLSRNNQLSAQQLIDILENFKNYRSMLPEQTKGIWAKSGTLNGVSTYAGYLYKDQAWWSFAVMINQPVEYKFRERLAVQLLNQ